MYFNKFPLFPYSFDNNTTYTVVKDIIIRVAASQELKNNYSIYDEYDVKDGEKPEDVSTKFYSSPQYHWVILMMNDVIDPRYDWVMSSENLDLYVKSKYGSSAANINATHHYVRSDNTAIIVDSDFTNPSNGAVALSVSNIDYEIAKNEEKRRIKVLKPTYLQPFISEFESLING